jgi:mRNA-degrading endonuclease RelE of RelBE toxin-antitoxin system
LDSQKSKYGHKIARLAYRIEFTADAHRDFRSLDTHIRASVRDALEVHLRHQPTKISKSRIKRLRELKQPQFRHRVEDCRIYYDVEDKAVTILGIVMKAASYRWLEDNSTQEKDD